MIVDIHQPFYPDPDMCEPCNRKVQEQKVRERAQAAGVTIIPPIKVQGAALDPYGHYSTLHPYIGADWESNG